MNPASMPTVTPTNNRQTHHDQQQHPTSTDVIECFSKPVPKISGQYTYAALKSVCDALKANTFSYATTLRGNQHSYLGLVLQQHHYNAMIPPNAGQLNSLIDPPFPGTHLNIPGGVTATVTNTIIHQHAEDKHLWQSSSDHCTTLTVTSTTFTYVIS